MRPKILVLVEWYLPGYKAGGLITATANLIEVLGDEFEFFVITRDRDLNDKRPYANTSCEKWVKSGEAQVFHTRDLSLSHLRQRILETKPDVIYCNSFFSVLTVKALLLRRLGLLLPCRIILAPRGEFSPAALGIKARKKLLYRSLAQPCGLLSGVNWHATSEFERWDIVKAVGATSASSPCMNVVPDLPRVRMHDQFDASSKPEKRPGTAQFFFLSRICRMKNLPFALEALAVLRGRVRFDIYGPVDDATHWEECQRQIGALPGNVTVHYRGAIPHENVPRTAESYHFFLLPTQGENFGHAILEAMTAGCPAVLSDRTPWRDLEDSGAGWSLPLESPELWRQALQHCVNMDQASYTAMSHQAHNYAERWAASDTSAKATAQLFYRVITRPRRPEASRRAEPSAEIRNF